MKKKPKTKSEAPEYQVRFYGVRDNKGGLLLAVRAYNRKPRTKEIERAMRVERATTAYLCENGECVKLFGAPLEQQQEEINGPVSPVPDIELRFFLVNHGYQVDVFQDGEKLGSVCKDFDGNHPIKKLRASLLECLGEATHTWRANL